MEYFTSFIGTAKNCDGFDKSLLFQCMKKVFIQQSSCTFLCAAILYINGSLTYPLVCFTFLKLVCISVANYFTIILVNKERKFIFDCLYPPGKLAGRRPILTMSPFFQYFPSVIFPWISDVASK